MKEKAKCPSCMKSDWVYKSDLAEKVGAIIGGGAGATFGFFGLAAFAGTTIGGLAGAIAAFHAVSAIGKRIGKNIDDNVIIRYKCGRCHKTFTK